jgi:stearoyl-CoA desaturase (delta-9 desaturase)
VAILRQRNIPGHHAFPQVARHGYTWYEVDFNWYGISALRAVGLAWDISLPKYGHEKKFLPADVPDSPAVPAALAAPEPDPVPEVAGD